MIKIKKNTMKNKVIKKKMLKRAALLLIVLQCAPMLTGCNVLKNKKAAVDEALISTCDSNKLYSGQYYVWHNESQNNIERDINTDISKFKNYTYDIFMPVYKETTLDSSLAEEENLRILWMNDENDSKIPTLYEGDELIYYSTEEIPTKIELERFYDHGYSIGVYGLEENIKGSGQYILNADSTMGVKANSTAAKIANYMTSDTSVVSIAQIGDKQLTSTDISKSGTVKGLIHGSSYDVAVYTGTNRHLIKMTADTRIFSSYELYTLTANSYSFIGDGIITINLPENLKSGYYCINGAGLFRYVANSTVYDNSTDFNDPGVIKDDNGKIIYDPRNVEPDKVTYNNDDNINDSNISSSTKTSVNVKGETVNVTVELGNIINKSIAQTPVVSYYRVDDMPNDDNSSIIDSNSYIIKATAEEIANGKISREINNLSDGVWIFTLSDVGNYETHKLNVELISGNIDSSIGDFTSKN